MHQQANHTFGLLGLLTLLTACAHTLPTASHHTGTWQTAATAPEFQATGRIAIQTPERGQQANFAWTYTAHIQTIDIRLPIGGSIGKLCADPQGAQLTTYNGQIHHAANLTQLSQNLLGYTLPLNNLNHWINGQIAPDEAHSITPEGYLKQSGWTIQRQTHPDAKPKLITLTHPEMTLRLAFTDFTPPQDPPTSCND